MKPTEEMSLEEYLNMLVKPAKRGNKHNKYNAQKTVVDGITFDSLAESRRYQYLKTWSGSGEITSLTCHPRWELCVNGKKISRYTADFSYILDGKLVVEDVKSSPTRTRDYIIRKKLMDAIYNIQITEVTKC